MKVAITITNIATGHQKVVIHDYPYGLREAEFYYNEGNGACNCNLAELFDGDENNPCMGGREFTAEVKPVT